EGASVVKTLNHIGYHDIEDAGRPAGDPERRAIAASTDGPRAEQLVTTLLGRMCLDAVQLGSLAEGRRVEPGAGLFGGWADRAKLEEPQPGTVRAAGRSGAGPEPDRRPRRSRRPRVTGPSARGDLAFVRLGPLDVGAGVLECVVEVDEQ